MNIIELVKAVGITSPDGFKLTVNPVQIDKLQDLVNAVIKARDAELIEGVSEPAHHIMSDGQCIGYYSAEQVAGAVAEAYQQGKHDEEMAQGPSEFEGWERDRLLQRIATLESTLKVALEALEKSMYPQKLQIAAIEKCKEVLHG